MKWRFDSRERQFSRPTPSRARSPGDDLAVSSHWVPGVRDATVVAAEDRPLYRLLMDLLADVQVPDCMPARLISDCEDLVGVKRAVENINRGRADIGGVSWGMGYCYNVRDAIEEYRDRGPLTLVAVGCSGSKCEVDDPVPAADLYQGTYWSCKDNYSATISDDQRVISAQHALLRFDEEIAYYERTLEDLEGIPVDSSGRLPNGEDVNTFLDQWTLSVYEGLTRWLLEATGGIDPRDVSLEILLRRNYRDPLEERGVFDRLRSPADLEISFPFQEVPEAQGGNGNQMGWMTNEVEKRSV
ncbi:DUF6884 domain-containing protein [Natronococcus wangiae]|uniref:DUF6884 domain-containing protein n=1 Tax=Natronococcus wangiae TaxID=3068275 RepID=UPI00273D0B33|nr:DUF6884 domain-containing protein [Natronococcus sp. AD5]